MTIAHEGTRSLVPAGAWRIDPARSSISWQLNGDKLHNGRFGAFEATLEIPHAWEHFDENGTLTNPDLRDQVADLMRAVADRVTVTVSA